MPRHRSRTPVLSLVVHPADAYGQIVRRDVATHTYRAILAPDGQVLAAHVLPGAPNPPTGLTHITPEHVTAGPDPDWNAFPDRLPF